MLLLLLLATSTLLLLTQLINSAVAHICAIALYNDGNQEIGFYIRLVGHTALHLSYQHVLCPILLWRQEEWRNRIVSNSNGSNISGNLQSSADTNNRRANHHHHQFVKDNNNAIVVAITSRGRPRIRQYENIAKCVDIRQDCQ